MKKFTALSLGILCFFCTAQRGDCANKICLALVVKNDALVVRKCLDSVRSMIDFLSVCDLGCTDDTIGEVEEFAREYGIEFSITPWVSGEVSQTLAFDVAREFLSQLSVSLEETYILAVQPDAICHVGDGFAKNRLELDRYCIRETSSLLSGYSYVPCLVRASCMGHGEAVRLPSLQLDVNDNQVYKLRKLEREAVRLTKQWKRDPLDPHVVFQLAGAHHGLKNYDRAIGLYEERTKQAESGEEAWFSRYRLGECYEAKELWTDAQYWYLEAYRHTPTRVEPLRKLATHYRYRGMNDLCTLFARQGHQTEVIDHVLYPSPPVHDHEIDEELSICAYYTSHREEGFFAANRLLLEKGLGWHLKNQTSLNILYYVKNIARSRRLSIPLQRPLIREGSDERYYPMNPSILRTEEGYEVICRSVNYTQKGSRDYTLVDLDGVARTRNFLLRFDAQFALLSQQEIRENLPRKREVGLSYIVGLEDCRLFRWNESLWCSCTTLDTSPCQTPQISLCKLRSAPQDESVFVETLTPLLGPDPCRCEKNWLPFIHEGKLRFIYSFDPFVIYTPDVTTGACTPLLSESQPGDYASFRGSAPPIAWGDGYLALVHQVIYYPDWTRVSLHRFVYFDKAFAIQHISLPFTFDHLGVEFCCGMTLDHAGAQLILTVGLEDHEAYFYFVDRDVVQSMLTDVGE